MSQINTNFYDAIIIGAGISGLVCGCYLAKAGMKVLIVEQHFKPGGYCSSFKRKDFTFDAAAHSFGGYRNGPLGMVFKELKIDNKIKIKNFNPTDIILTPDKKIFFWNNIDKTIKNLQNNFSDEHDTINKFFNLLINPTPHFFSCLRNRTFKDLLDTFFKNDILKSILSFPLFGNGGLPSSLMSAFIGVKIYTECLLDGGYYPEGGMQALPNALSEIFIEFGGTLQLSCLAKNIIIKDNKVAGVTLEKDVHIPSNYVISNCDTKQTFLKLLSKTNITEEFTSIIDNMTPTFSTFIIYLGLNKYFKNSFNYHTNIWFLPHYNIDKMYMSKKRGNLSELDGYLVHVFPKNNTITAYLHAPFKNKKYWDNNKNNILNSLIKSIDNHILPGLSKQIIYKETATPYTLYKYTLNHKGAAYGWASIPSQLALPNFRKPSFIKNLYLTGHWTTHGIGIPGVTYLGYDTAKSILKRANIKIS